MTTLIPTRMEKCKGAMLATAIGDALGWPNEAQARNTATNSKVNDCFIEWTRRCSRPYWHNEKILPGEYSDDTQMMLSVSRSLIAGNWKKILINAELPFWLRYERGGGKALLKAANTYKKGMSLWESGYTTSYTRGYFNAGGNGAVMRILPHVIAATHKLDIAKLMIEAIEDSLITHGHPRAILGATCYAFALDYLLRKETILEYGELVKAVLDGQNDWGAYPNSDLFEDWLHVASQHRDFEYYHEWDNVRKNMIHQLEYIKDSLKKGLMLDDTSVMTRLECFSKVNGAGDVAALTAVYLASRYANSPALGIKVPAFSLGSDTDTIASITGGLLGMLCGTNWIPSEWKLVQDYDCLNRITELLLSENSKDAAKAHLASEKEQKNNWKSTPIGLLRYLGATTLQNGKNAIVTTKWQSDMGQTMYFKDYKRDSYEMSKPEGQIQIQMQPTSSEAKPQAAILQAPVQASTEREKVAVFVQESLVPLEQQKQFLLNVTNINALLKDTQCNKKITFGKVLDIIKALIDGDNASAVIARRFKVDETMIDIIKKHIK